MLDVKTAGVSPINTLSGIEPGTLCPVSRLRNKHAAVTCALCSVHRHLQSLTTLYKKQSILLVNFDSWVPSFYNRFWN